MRMGCLTRFGCLALVACIALVAWITHDRWWYRVTGHAATSVPTGPVWEPLTPQGAERTRKMLDRLSKPSGQVFGNLSGGDVAS